ncbi:hypothetical protein SASPL_104717 [Salvia splendens]|uniref:Uncharacterized protein n=1 Tax=Salvia splendens TaxID=180675 RepID=A0A8X8YHQ0_SALSN|nr:hypothetical protein SASPL_104717 [Salvia splendens]
MIRGTALYQRAWDGLWPLERRCQRELYNFGMETLLKLDLNGTRSFFDAFFELDPHLWHGFLSSRLSLGELITLGLSLFGHASAPTKLDMLTKCPVPIAKMQKIKMLKRQIMERKAICGKGQRKSSCGVLDLIIRYLGLNHGGMQKLIRAERILVGRKNKSLTCGIGVTAPKARTRGKLKPLAVYR